MAISGLFAGLAAAVDIFGWKYTAGVLDIQASAVGFVGIAVALLGRSTAIGVGLAAFIFGALDYGTTRGLDPEVFDPTLAGQPEPDDPGARRPLRRRRPPDSLPVEPPQEALRIAAHVREGRMSVPALTPKRIGVIGVVLGALAFWLALPPVHVRNLVVPVLFAALRCRGRHLRRARR